ncbi:hypothetical protein [Glaciibacter sp. 2TAF33]|uniref:hypothetical protein n=1 Tax=Glaciibacter sp. 2TAF33 TaxID=3233015 RepID=UPI003F934B26
MKLLPLAGLAGAAVLSTIALTDALWQGFEGTPPPWGVQGGHDWMLAGVNLGHAVPYLLLTAVLMQVGPQLDSGGFTRWVRRLLIVTFLLFAVMMLWGAITGANSESLGVFEAGTTILFFALLLLPIILGFAMLRRRDVRLPAILLAGSLVPVVLMFVLSELTSFAHPAYAEALALFGVALLPFALEPRRAESAVGAVSGASEAVSR